MDHSPFTVTSGTLIWPLTQEGRQFWVRDEEGRDHPFPYDSTMLPMLPTHRVTVVDAGADEYGVLRVCLLINYATDRHAIYRERLPLGEYSGAGCMSLFLTALGILIAAGSACAGPGGDCAALFGAAICIGMGLWGFYTTRQNTDAVDRHNAQLLDALDRVLHEHVSVCNGGKIYR
jgi:hypothetical protein